MVNSAQFVHQPFTFYLLLSIISPEISSGRISGVHFTKIKDSRNSTAGCGGGGGDYQMKGTRMLHVSLSGVNY